MVVLLLENYLNLLKNEINIVYTQNIKYKKVIVFALVIVYI